MNISPFLTALLSYLVVLPAAAICYFPMLHQLRYGRRQFLPAAAGFLALLVLAAYVTARFNLHINLILLPLLALFFVFYRRSVTADASTALAVFFTVCTLMSILANYANGFDALLHPHGGADLLCPENALMQMGLNLLAALLLLLPLRKYGVRLVDELHIRRVWYLTVPISAILFVINLYLRPLQYETLYINRIFLVFWMSLTMTLLAFLLLAVIFYHIVMGLLNAAEMAERNRILEMQESQYRTQQKYLASTAHIRHDFRHTIRTLEELSAAGDFDALCAYLRDYVSDLPQNEVVQYCQNSAVNAVLNYYAQSAIQEHIELNWRIELPGSLPISDVDLCGIIGNILENAVAACAELPEERRWIQFTVMPVNGAQLCIVATNSFSGAVQQEDGHYRSTRRGGGIGLLSITSAAEKYGGRAEFSHEGTEFYSNVMLPLARGSAQTADG